MGAKDSGHPRPIRRAALLLITILPFAGCTTPAAPPPERPGDFTLAVTLFSPRPAYDPITGRPRIDPDDPVTDTLWDRDARFVLEPDGLLRAEFGSAARLMGFPPIARRLRPEEFDALYTLARQRGLLEPDPKGQIPTATTFRPAGDYPEAVVEVALDGRRRTLARPVGPEGDRAAATLVEELTQMVWMGAQ